MSSDRTDNKDAGVEPCCDQHTTPEGKLQTHSDGCWVNPRHHLCAVNRIHELKRQIDRYEAALREIAGEDYRGNRPHSATVAWKALNPDV